MKDFDKASEFKKLAYMVNTTLIVTHAALLAAFYLLRVYPMVYFNVGSVLLYAVCFLVIYRQHPQTFIILLLIEIWLHLAAATICVGWDGGFYLYNFGVISVIFYTKYVYFEKKTMRHVPTLVVIVSVSLFIALHIYCYRIMPLYPIGHRDAHWLYLANSILIFALIIISLYNYTYFAITNEQMLHYIADTDELTQIFNRRHATELLRDIWSQAEEGHTRFCVSILDVDNFKHINDRYGHDAGDYVLKTIAAIMVRTCSQHGDTAKAARWGGDEFLIVQEYDGERVTLAMCQDVIQRIHDAVNEQAFCHQSQRLNTSLTVGFAAHRAGLSIDETFKIADEHLYKGKENGKNCVIFD